MAFRLVALGLFAFAKAEDIASAVEVDDECSGEKACALNALQRHGVQSVDEELAEVDESAAQQYSVYWVYGNAGYNCDQVCSTKQFQGTRMVCDARAFGLAPDAAGVMKAAQAAGTRCSMTWANNGAFAKICAYGHAFDNVPAICMASKCGVDPQGLCAYSAHNAATCAGPAPNGFSRICPCNVASQTPAPAPQYSHYAPAPAPQQSQYRPAPTPQQYAPAPAPQQSQHAPAPQQPQYVPPAPAPQQSQYAPTPAPSKHEKCVTKTDISCTMASCSKTMGPTECNYKDGSWIHKRCHCKKGYCFKDDKCRKA